MKKILYVIPALILAAVAILAQPNSGPIIPGPIDRNGFIASNNGRGTNTTIVSSLSVTNGAAVVALQSQAGQGGGTYRFLEDGDIKWSISGEGNSFSINSGAGTLLTAEEPSGLVTVTDALTVGVGATVDIGSGNVQASGTVSAETSLSSGGTISATGSGNITANSGNISTTSGNITATAGSVSASGHTVSQSFSVQTPGNTQTTLGSIAVAAGSVVGVEAHVTAKQSASANGAYYVVRATGVNNGGTTAIIGTASTTTVGETITGTADATIDFDNGTDTARVRVTGVTATTIDWKTQVTVTVVSN